MQAADKISSKIRKAMEIPSCSICMEPMTKNLCIYTNCGHVYHHECGMNSIQQDKRCPNCRKRSTELAKIHFQIEEISEVEQQMQEILSTLSEGDQYKLADTISKYEEQAKDLLKLRQQVQVYQERSATLDLSNKNLQQENQQLAEKVKDLQQKKFELKDQNQRLEIQCDCLLTKFEATQAETKSLKQRIVELNYLEKISKVIESQNDEDAHVKFIRQNLPPQKFAQEIYDLYLLKCSQIKSLQKELDRTMEEKESLKKSALKDKRHYEDMLRENNNLHNHIRKSVFDRERSPENSDINMSKDDGDKQYKKRSLQLTQPIFGRSTLLSASMKINEIKPPDQNNNYKGSFLNRPGNSQLYTKTNKPS